MIVESKERLGHGRQAIRRDAVCIRGRWLDLGEVLNTAMLDDANVDAMAQRMLIARPYPYLVLDGLFNPVLLELVREEFDLYGQSAWRTVQTKYEKTRRSLVGSAMGPASQIYFGIANSGLMVNLLSRVSAVEDLIADVHLYNGGLHETLPGGKFGIHRDFDRHKRTGLNNEMVLLTYLNEGWEPAWKGALEFWDAGSRQMVASVEPVMGRTVLMRHGPHHFHGHPEPMSAPEGVTRRSLATYYYTNRHAAVDRVDFVSSVYLNPDRRDGLRQTARAMLPSVLWHWLRRVSGRPD